MYKNTMYISTITSWLHSQWQSYIAIKIALWVWLSQQFSSRRRTSNKNNTEYRTSVQKLLCYTKTKKTLKRNKLRNNFFTVTEIVLKRPSSLLKPKFQHKFNLILDIFYENWCYPNCKHCITTVFWFQTITVIVPLQKFRQ